MITLTLERFSWDCGDGCCSSSGATVLIEETGKYSFTYGTEDSSTIESDSELYINALNTYLETK